MKTALLRAAIQSLIDWLCFFFSLSFIYAHTHIHSHFVTGCCEFVRPPIVCRWKWRMRERYNYCFLYKVCVLVCFKDRKIDLGWILSYRNAPFPPIDMFPGPVSWTYARMMTIGSTCSFAPTSSEAFGGYNQMLVRTKSMLIGCLEGKTTGQSHFSDVEIHFRRCKNQEQILKARRQQEYYCRYHCEQKLSRDGLTLFNLIRWIDWFQRARQARMTTLPRFRWDRVALLLSSLLYWLILFFFNCGEKVKGCLLLLLLLPLPFPSSSLL